MEKFKIIAPIIVAIFCFNACEISWPTSDPDPDRPIKGQTEVTNTSVKPDTVVPGTIVTLGFNHIEENNPNFVVKWDADPIYLIPINGVIDSNFVNFNTSFFTDTTLSGIQRYLVPFIVEDTTETDPFSVRINGAVGLYIDYR